MPFARKLAAAALAAVTATSGMAQDIAVIGGSIEDGFWNVVKKGVEDAALMVEANGGTVRYLRVPNYDNFSRDLVTLIEQSVTQGVDGIAIPIWIPETEIPALQAAREDGVVITLYNAGAQHMDAVQALNYFGSDEYMAGFEGGKYMAGRGSRHILCLIQIPGAGNLENRCRGVADGAAAANSKVTILRAPAELDGHVPATTRVLRGTLRDDPTIDAVMTLAAWASDAATGAVESLSPAKPIMIGTFDLSPNILARIASGTQVMAIDQQPYLQGYLATSSLFAHLAFGTRVVTKPVLTGPAIIDAGNIDSAMTGVAEGAR